MVDGLVRLLRPLLDFLSKHTTYHKKRSIRTSCSCCCNLSEEERLIDGPE